MAKVDIHYFNQVLDCAVRQGYSRDQILSHLAIQLIDNQQRVDTQQMTRVVQYVWAKLNDEFLGCTAQPCKIGVFPFMARHVLHYQTLEQMLEQGISFYNLVTDDITMKLQRRGEVAEFEFCFANPERDPNHFFLEFWLIIWHRFSSWLIDVKIPLNHVCFSHSKPRHWQEVKLLFPCRHSYDRPTIKLCFSAKYLDLPCIRTQQQLTLFLRNSPADLITIPGSDLGYKTKVEALLTHHQDKVLDCPNFEVIAQQLNISSQTLRRRLSVEGTSYPKIKDQIRYDLAIEYLCTGNHSINDIAAILGFSEPRSFTRAFKHWTGLSPSKYAKSQQKSAY